MFKFIHSKAYEGILGMEHGNSKKGKEGELAVIEAYKPEFDLKYEAQKVMFRSDFY